MPSTMSKPLNLNQIIDLHDILINDVKRLGYVDPEKFKEFINFLAYTDIAQSVADGVVKEYVDATNHKENTELDENSAALSGSQQWCKELIRLGTLGILTKLILTHSEAFKSRICIDKNDKNEKFSWHLDWKFKENDQKAATDNDGTK